MRSSRVFAFGLVASLVPACSSGSDGGEATVASGGASSGAGGSASTTGGNASLGGQTSSGGAVLGGGGAGTGAAPAAGGSSASGGTSAGGAAGAGNGGAGAGTGGASTGGTGGTGTGGAGNVALVNPQPGSKFFVGANFWNIDWEGQDDFFTSGVNFATTTNPWKSAFLDDLAPYKVLRFMDWNQTNNASNSQAKWETRKQKTAEQNEPVAFEWQIDLSNRAKKDYWLNVPHEASPDYWTKLATLVKDTLDPSLRVYVEYSNEVWNGGFPQNAYAAGKAGELGLKGSIPASSYYVYASVRLFEAFEGVFGKGSPRLVKVLAGQAAWNGPCDAHVIALADATINPKGTKPDFYAIAPYFGGKTLKELGDSIPTVTDWTKNSKSCASGGGMPLISYEGGSDSFSAPNNGCTTLQHDAGMHDLYTSYLDGIAGAGLKGPFMQYTHTGACWGLKEKTSDSLETSPKYKGVTDWLAAHP